MERWPIRLVEACWLLWVVVWAAGWLYNLARGPRAQRQAAHGWILLAAALAWWLAHRVTGLPGGTVIRGSLAPVVGGVLLIAGTAFTIWARVVLGRMWSSAPSVKEGHELQTAGPYAVTRHPIYTGMLAMAFGTALADGTLRIIVLALAFLVYVLTKIRTEERLIVETFGDRYRDYRQTTPQLIPGLRGRRRPP